MKKIKVGIVDTNTSNIKSVYHALNMHQVDINYIKSNKDKHEIDAMIVPGIGNFSYVMEKLKQNSLDKFILEKIERKIPSLFICVGMQILFTKSFEFGEHEGLNIFNGTVKKIPEKDEEKRKIRSIPNIGWNKIDIIKNDTIFKNIKQNSFFYFTHSYYVVPSENNMISSTSDYLDFRYCSSISEKNIHATQFHPEKSGKVGLEIYKNFLDLV